MYYETIVVILLLLIIALLVTLVQQESRRADAMAALSDQLHTRIRAEGRRLFAQQEAYLSLRDRLGLRKGLPYSRNWSAAPDFLKLIADHTLSAQPATVVECGCGLTSLVLARCCAINSRGELFSLENGTEYADKTRAELARYELDKQAVVLDSPLKSYTLGEREYLWYDLDALPERKIDMLVIDGPPGFIQRHSRYPALPLLFDRLADGCVVFMDDAARPDEWELVEMWKAEFPAIESEYVDTECGCSIVRIHKTSRESRVES